MSTPANRPERRPSRPQTKSSKPNRRRNPWMLLVKVAFGLAMAGALAGVGGVAGLFWIYGRDLPDIRTAQDYRPRQATRIVASDGAVVSTIVGEDAVQRTVVPLDQISPFMRDAIIAAEDAGFYEHEGLDYLGLTRAVLINLRRGQLTQGASTITQQVVKNLILTPERTIRRKVQEAILSFRLERNLTKDQILNIYLNEVFFGVRYYGVEEAARYYFGHGAAELTLPESALLAGLVQSPNRYNPRRHPERAMSRRGYVLRQMWEKGMIEESAYREADAAPLVLADLNEVAPWEGRFGYYVDAVRRELEGIVPADVLDAGGLLVTTALEIPAQIAAEDELAAGLRGFDARHGYHTPFATVEGDAGIAQWRAENAEDVESVGLQPSRTYHAVVVSSGDEVTRLGVGPYTVELSRIPLSRVRPDERPWAEIFPIGAVFSVEVDASVPPEVLAAGEGEVRLGRSAEGAVVVIRPSDGRVVALTGGYDFETSAFNRAVQARRQVGSTFKPFVYGAALRARVATAATVYLDQPVTFPLDAGRTWSPRNYDGEFEGRMTVRQALARSRNVIAVRVGEQVGVGAVTQFAADCGITSPLTDNLTLMIGSAELTPLELTAGFACLAAGGVRREPRLITRVETSSGDVIFEAADEGVQGVEPDVAWLTNSLMRSVVEGGTASSARSLERPLAGKTGTTNEARDAWFVGFSTDYVAGVWIGRDNNETLGRGEAGGRSALPVWTTIMGRIHEGRVATEFAAAPTGIVEAVVDPATGLLARPGMEGAYTEFFLSGTAPREYAPTTSDRSVNDVLLGGGTGAGDGSGETGGDDDGF